VRVALGLQLGGAFGNLMDRLRLGHVTDFIHFHFWPVFNVADMSIVGGVILLAFTMWREGKEPAQPALQAAESTDSNPPAV
jgi:signal peptidase II